MLEVLIGAGALLMGVTISRLNRRRDAAAHAGHHEPLR
jgi:hypothetical protein